MCDIGVHHVSLNVVDAVTSVRFYGKVLEMALRDDRPDFDLDGARIQSDDRQIHLLEAPDFVPKEGQHFALRVADIDATQSHLLHHDVKASGPSELPGICHQCFFRDPTGNLIEVNQPISVTS